MTMAALQSIFQRAVALCQPKKDRDSTNSALLREQTILPVFVIFGMRSGSTLLMELMSKDARCSVERVFPYEAKYLSWPAKNAALLDGWRFHEIEHIDPFKDQVLNVYPTYWRHHLSDADQIGLPSGSTVFAQMWESFEKAILAKAPETRYYLEKTHPWVIPIVRRNLKAFTIYPFRDPRDKFVSARAFLKGADKFSATRRENDSDLDHALRVSCQYLKQYENFKQEPDPSMTAKIRYEDLVADTDNALAELRRKTGINIAATSTHSLYDVHKTSADVSSSLSRWKRGELEENLQRTIEYLLHDAMDELGYERGFDLGRERIVINFDASNHDHSGLAIAGGEITSVTSRGAAVRVSNHQCQMNLPFEPFNAQDFSEVWLCMSGEVGNFAKLYWRSASQDFSEERCRQKFHDPSRHYRVIRFKLSDHPEWHGRIQELRLNPFNSDNSIGHEHPGYIRWIQLIPAKI